MFIFFCQIFVPPLSFAVELRPFLFCLGSFFIQSGPFYMIGGSFQRKSQKGSNWFFGVINHSFSPDHGLHARFFLWSLCFIDVLPLFYIWFYETSFVLYHLIDYIEANANSRKVRWCITECYYSKTFIKSKVLWKIRSIRWQLTEWVRASCFERGTELPALCCIKK